MGKVVLVETPSVETAQTTRASSVVADMRRQSWVI